MTVVAFVVLGTAIFVIAGNRYRRIDTSLRRITRILGTNVVVVTSRGGAGACPGRIAFVGVRANVFVVTRNELWHVRTSCRRIADVSRAPVAIRALFLDSRANTLVTKVICRTSVVVVAWYLNGFVFAPFGRVAIIKRTWVSVIAKQSLAGAFAAGAGVLVGTGIAIIARARLRRIATQAIEQTTIRSTRVVVITGQARSFAHTRYTTISDRTGVAIVARNTG